MPHVHMLVFIEKDSQKMAPWTVDQYVSARIPALPRMEDTSPEANQARRKWYYVTSLMMHDCNAACEYTREVDGVIKTFCKKHFPKSFADNTEINGNFEIIRIYIYFRCSLYELCA